MNNASFKVNKIDNRFKYYKSPYNMRYIIDIPMHVSKLIINVQFRQDLAEHFKNIYGSSMSPVRNSPYIGEYHGQDYETFRIFVRDESMIDTALMATL